MSVYRATVEILIVVEDDCDYPDAYVADGLTAILTEEMRKYHDHSCLLDWRYADSSPRSYRAIEMDCDPDTYNPDESPWPAMVIISPEED